MSIHVPGRRLLHGITLPFVRKKVTGHGGGRPVAASLSLTSMIDFLVVTVVFLLMSFSTSSECGCLDRNVRVPTAANFLDMIDAPVAVVSGGAITVDGAMAGDTRAIDDSKRLQRVDELFNVLKGKREVWKQLRPGREFPGVVLLKIYQDVPAVVVKSIFQTAAYAGYPNVSFVVEGIPKTKG